LAGEVTFIYLRGEKVSIPSGKAIDIVRPDFNIIITNTKLGEGVTIWSNVNIYGAIIGPGCKIGAFVEIRKGVELGKNVKIEPFVFIPEGVKIGDCVFIGPNVIFTNDPYPKACEEDGSLVKEYKIVPTYVEDFAAIGAGSTIRCGIRIGRGALIGMGSIVTNDVPAGAVVYGVKAEIRKFLKKG
jgi:acetyltransferase-like isoleucine patch superfamily enzyme